MNTVTVDASKKYQIHIGTNLLREIGRYIGSTAKGNRVAIISDSNVWPLYGDSVLQSLNDFDYTVCSYVISAGEGSKNAKNYLKILNYLSQMELTRADCIVALGGGVVGDLAGFVAATYLRGVTFVQVPTSLLAMVDSSVGGKTAIDLPAGKNLAGAFYQPSLVLCDLDALNSLPYDVFLDGCAEVIKYGILFDAKLFDHLSKHGPDFDREYVITRCIELKRDVVNRDERDLRDRQLLNLGHTIGHSIEANSFYSISHGKAVAIGTNLIAASAVSCGLCHGQVQQKIQNILLTFGLPVMSSYSAKELATVALRDKKRVNDTIGLILPKEIGQCVIYPYPIQTLESFIKAGQDYASHSLPR